MARQASNNRRGMSSARSSSQRAGHDRQGLPMQTSWASLEPLEPRLMLSAGPALVILADSFTTPVQPGVSHLSVSPARWGPQLAVSYFSRGVTQDVPLAFVATEFTGNYSDSTPGGTLKKIQITSLPTQGTLKLGTTPVALNQEIAVGAIGTLSYTPDAGYTGSDSFDWDGSDGSDYTGAPASVYLTVDPANGLDGTYSVKESWSVTVTDPYSPGDGNPTRVFTRTGVATGTIQVVDGGFELINKIGASVGALEGDIQYDGSQYTVTSKPVLYAFAGVGAGFDAIAKFSFFTVLVPLPSSFGFSLFQRDDQFTATGSGYSDLHGLGTAVDGNGQRYDATSVSKLTLTATAAPTISAVSPNKGMVTGGTQVTITGKNLANATAVNFGTQATSSFTFNKATKTITATCPAESAGTVDVTVTTGEGTSPTSAADRFTYGFPDLAAAFGATMKLPAGGISGDGKAITVPVVVKNVGSMPLPAGQKIDIEIDAKDASGVLTTLKTLTGQSVSSLGAGKSATFTAPVTLPPGLAAGTYSLVAVVDSSDKVTADSASDNNTVTSSGTIAVTQGYVDLAGVLGATWTLPSSVLAGKSLSGSVSVVVKNLGNVALPKGQQVNIEFRARDLTHPANPDITLGTLSDQSVTALAANGSKTFSMTIRRSAGLPADQYEILADIVPVQPLTESNLANDLATLTAAGLGKTLVVS
jgi:hypothetical protein